MFKWLSNKIIDSYIKTKIKELQKIDVKKKILDYYEAHKDEIIKKAFQALEKLIKDMVAKATEKSKDKTKK